MMSLAGKSASKAELSEIIDMRHASDDGSLRSFVDLPR